MALFAFWVRRESGANVVLNEWIVRTTDNNLLKNPFSWKIKKVIVGNCFIYVCKVYPVTVPNITPFFWIAAAGTVVIWGAGWVTWVLCALGCLGFFWTSQFYYAMIKLMLFKKGVSKCCHRLKLVDLVEEVIL